MTERAWTSGPCQHCMDEGRAQLVLVEGSWQPWPIVATRPDNAPMITTEVCPICDTERFNTEEVPRLNAKIAAFSAR